MTQLDPNVKLNPLQIMQVMVERRPTMTRFNVPATCSQVADMLLGSVMAGVKRRNMQFVSTPDLESQIQQMANWLTTNDQRCCCLLCGKFGNGKTTLVRALQDLVNYCCISDPYTRGVWKFKFLDAKEIAWMCRCKHDDWRALQTERMLAIDDLGTEPVEVMDYGNHQNPVIDLLYKRYDLQLTTIITTNLLPSEIIETYGERLADRLREMAYRIVYENKSYRQ